MSVQSKIFEYEEDKNGNFVLFMPIDFGSLFYWHPTLIWVLVRKMGEKPGKAAADLHYHSVSLCVDRGNFHRSLICSCLSISSEN